MLPSDEFSQKQLTLVQRATSGDEDALAELFVGLKPRLRRIIEIRMDQQLKGRIDPSDVLHEAYLDLAKKLPDFPSKGISLFVWMRMVTNECMINLHRKHRGVQKRDPKCEVSIDHGQSSACLAGNLIGKFSSVSGKAIRNEVRERLMQVIESMDDVDREVIIMRAFEGLSNVEAAQVLALSENGASSRFVRAIGRLKKMLNEVPGFGEVVDL